MFNNIFYKTKSVNDLFELQYYFDMMFVPYITYRHNRYLYIRKLIEFGEISFLMPFLVIYTTVSYYAR